MTRLRAIAVNNWQGLILAGMFLAAPFGFVLGGPMREAVGFYMAIAVGPALVALYRPRTLGLFVCLCGGWYAVARVGVLTAQTPATVAAFAHAQWTYWAVLIGVLICLAVPVAPKRYRLDWWLNVICLSALLMCAWTVLQGLGIDPLLHRSAEYPAGWSPWRIGSLVGHANFLAAYLAVCAPFFCRGRWIVLLPVIVAAIAVQETTGGILALAAGLGYLALVRWGRKKFLIGLAVGIVLGCLFVTFIDPIYCSMAPRLRTWAAAADVTLLGHGPGSWRMLEAAKFNSPFVFNEYLQVLYEFGLIGLGLVVWFLARVFFKKPSKPWPDIYRLLGVFVREIKEPPPPLWPGYHLKAALIAMAVNCGVNPFFHVPVTAALGLVILGLYEVAYGWEPVRRP